MGGGRPAGVTLRPSRQPRPSPAGLTAPGTDRRDPAHHCGAGTSGCAANH